MTTRLDNARIIRISPSNEPSLLKGCSILVDEDSISYVGDSKFDADHAIDCKGGLLLPGFVNAHTHSPLCLLRGGGEDCSLPIWLKTKVWPFEASLTYESCYWGAMLNIAESLRNGITAFCDMYTFPEAVAQAYKDTGCRALVTPTVTDELLIYDDAILDRIAELSRKYDGDELIKIGIGPHSIYTCNDETLKKVSKLKENLNLTVHIHLSETWEENVACRKTHGGLSPLQRADFFNLIGQRSILAHCVHFSDSDISLIRERRATIAHCPKSNLKLGNGIAPLKAFLQAGVNVGIGTDSSASNNCQDIMEEVRYAALLQKGFNKTPQVITIGECLSMMTRAPLEGMGFENVGEIREGNKADLVLLDTSQMSWLPNNDSLSDFIYSSKSSDVFMTMIGGRILYHDGEYSTLDIEQLKSRISKLAPKN